MKDGQKTLSSSRPSDVTIESDLTVEDVRGRIVPGASFIVYDMDGKAGRGMIIEVVKQI